MFEITSTYFTGIFTPTVSGTYMLSAQVQSNGDSGRVVIRRNGVVVCRGWVIADHDVTTTCSLAVRLTAGDSVKVTGGVEHANVKTFAGYFSGHLVQVDRSN